MEGGRYVGPLLLTTLEQMFNGRRGDSGSSVGGGRRSSGGGGSGSSGRSGGSGGAGGGSGGNIWARVGEAQARGPEDLELSQG